MNYPPILPDERVDEVNESIRLIQKKQGLTFGTDAYLLAAFTRPSPRARAVDLGSGTGIIPLLLLARSKVATAVAVEIQPSFAELIRRNADLNRFGDRLHAICADVRELKPTDLDGEVDLVLANPPYMRCDTGKRNEHDEKYIARHEVCGTVADFCHAAARLLRHGGRFVTVWRPDRLTELLAAMHAAKLEPKRMTFVHADTASEPCMLLTEAVKGGAPSLRISPPLFLYTLAKNSGGTRTLTDTAQEIYDNCAFPSAFFSEQKIPYKKENKT